MNDISRRRVLRGVAAGMGGLGVAATGTAAGDTHGDIIDELNGSGDGGGGGDGCDLTVGRDEDATYASIQAALDDAAAGDVICVAPGVYEEQLTVSTADVGLAATGSAADTVIRSSGTTVDVQAPDVFLFKFGVQNTTDGGTAIDAGPRTGMRRCQVTVEDGTGVAATDSFSAVDNAFDDTGVDAFTGVGVSAEGVVGTQDDDGDGIYLARNSFDRFRHGVHLTDCEEVAIRSNTFDTNRYDGVRLESTAEGPTLRRFLVDGNEFLNNGLGMVLFEAEGARIEQVYVLENVFDNYSFGVYTSTRKIPYDVDNDGETEPTPAPGALRGGAVHATCNYWGVPSGPEADDNLFADRNWFTRQALPNGDKVTEGVDFTPWQTQEHDTSDGNTCVGGQLQAQL